MKTNRFLKSITVAFSLAVFSTAGCAEKEPTAKAALPPAKDAASTAVMTTLPGSTAAVQVAPAASPDAAIPKWIDIKDCTYDTRAQFLAGFNRLQARVDEQIRSLSARRAAMTSTADTKDWDFAMKEMGDARSNLKSMGEELRKATPETWDQEKDKVGQAWVRTQEAYDKVKSSMTS
jgi:hypothetical protein